MGKRRKVEESPKRDVGFVMVEGHLVRKEDERRIRDMAILDKGWNNTEEGKAIIAAAKKEKGKHAK